MFGPLRYFVLLLSILLWWWIVGHYLDQRFTNRTGTQQRAPVLASFLLVLAIALIALGVSELSQEFRRWWTYSREIATTHNLLLLRSIALSIWCFVLGFEALQTARRRFIAGSSRKMDIPSSRRGTQNF
jgi:hypothetical protein